MLRLTRAIGTYMLISALVSTDAAHAATYYVATTGSNSNPGTSSQPWQTVGHAASKMVAGDTTYVRGGVYNERGVRFRVSGTAISPIKLLNYPGESPIIHCQSNLTSDAQMILIQNSAGSKQPMGWFTIEGFEVRHCSRAIKFYNLHDSVIRRNWFHDTMDTPIQGPGTRILIDRNTISNIGTPTERAHGIYSNGTAFTITNNIIYGVTYYGIQQNGSASSIFDPAKYAGLEFAESTNWIIANNVIAYNGAPGGGIVVWGSRCSGTRIENNIFYENTPTSSNKVAQGIHFQSPGSVSGVIIRNNLAYATGEGGLGFIEHGGALEGINYTESGNIVNTDDPKFVNAPATLPPLPNFTLTERSPAIDKGLPLAETRIAFDGTSRPQGRGYDIGAYEYKVDSDAQSPKAPGALQIQ